MLDFKFIANFFLKRFIIFFDILTLLYELIFKLNPSYFLKYLLLNFQIINEVIFY